MAPPLVVVKDQVKEEPFKHLLTLAQVEPSRSICSIHGHQSGASCLQCDEADPEAVQLRKIAASPSSGLPVDVQSMIDKAVKDALAQQSAFQSWQAQQSPVANAGSPPLPGAVAVAPVKGFEQVEQVGDATYGWSPGMATWQRIDEAPAPVQVDDPQNPPTDTSQASQSE